MKQNKHKDFRVGSFAAVNTGKILGCSSNIRFKAKYGGSGFVYDNSGSVAHSVAVKCVKGTGDLAGFIFRNTGEVRHCGFLASPGKQTDGEKPASRRFVDEELLVDDSLSVEDIYRSLNLEGVWKNETSDSLEPDMTANHAAVESALPRVEIEDGEQLLSIIQEINDGNVQASRTHYVLTRNINLHGKKIDPIGASESTAFCGIFDGNGMTVSNFVVQAKAREYAGFFGFAKNAVVVNLKLDCVMKGVGGRNAGGMVGVCSNSRFENCAVFLSADPSTCFGGFAGRNSGSIINCYVCGKIAFPIILWSWLLLLGLLLLLLLLTVIPERDDAYVPEVIDPNQVPVINNNNVAPPAEGTSRISFEVYQEVYISATTMVGKMEYVNPARATQDVVIHICVSDSELLKAGYNLAAVGVRTEEEMAAEGYDPDALYTELYRSGRIQIGYGVDNCKLSPLPNGKTLVSGDYEMVIMIDSYDPVTNEKAIVNAQVPITVHIVDQ